ncbi:hypothetical protein [Leptolyngbya ohadii]|uniref:hypothetical protein n=1 Tax=Leptolyngbya ohadii TaxID=1962290 RepID=UPI00117B2B5F|nr:hypothetical protein [Leptolyngbya ohadii]
MWTVSALTTRAIVRSLARVSHVNQLISIRQLVFYEDPQGEYRNTDELMRQLQPSVAQVMKAFRSDLQDVDRKYQRFTSGGTCSCGNQSCNE